jgi:cysteine desulfuration protein SufE
MMGIEEKEKEILEEFELFGEDWEGKYEHIIDLGKHLPLLHENEKTDDMLIKGCQSRVWLRSEMKDGKLYFRADSDAIITKGLIALMVRVLSGEKPIDIIGAKLEFIDRIGLKEHLSPTRANGLVSMINRMKSDAIILSK